MYFKRHTLKKETEEKTILQFTVWKKEWECIKEIIVRRQDVLCTSRKEKLHGKSLPRGDAT